MLLLAAGGCATSQPAAGEGTARPTGHADEERGPGAAAAEPPKLPVPSEPDPDALEELLRAAPTRRLGSTGPDGGTLVGTDTDRTAAAPAKEAEPPAGPPPPEPQLRAGRMEIQPWISNPAIERTAREQLYWPLVQRCRDPEGAILPPEAITLVFTIRTDGSVDPASVAATANDERYEAAAECVVREFSALSFAGPPATIGNTTRVISTLPSVD